MNIRRNAKNYRLGETHHRARYDDATVESVRQMNDDGLGYKRIAKILGISSNTIRDWVYYRTRA